MEPALNLVPSTSLSTASSISVAKTANSLGLHDTLQYGQRSLAAEVKQGHPLQGRLENWDETRENLNLTLARNVYGLHAPVRLLMERHLVQQNEAPLKFGGFTKKSNIHLDILMGRDEEIDTGDVLIEREETKELPDFHRMMEKRLNL